MMGTVGGLLVEQEAGMFESRNNAIRGRNEGKKRPRPFGDRTVELGFGLCFQQNDIAGVGGGKNRRDRP